jgi:hypothetical protein
MTLGELRGDIVETIKCNKKVALAIIAGAVIGINSLNAENNVDLNQGLNNLTQSEITVGQQNCIDMKTELSSIKAEKMKDIGLDVKIAQGCGVKIK